MHMYKQKDTPCRISLFLTSVAINSFTVVVILFAIAVFTIDVIAL